MLLPWRNWYHCMASTFGQWLPGDERGFRTRHHREHIEGDYKNPPPQGKYAGRLARSRRLMNRPPVWLPPAAREEACRRIAEALRHYGVEVVDLCVTATHFHVLARFSPFVIAPPSPHAAASASMRPALLGHASALPCARRSDVATPVSDAVDSKVVGHEFVGPEHVVSEHAATEHVVAEIVFPEIGAVPDIPWEQLKSLIESAAGYFTDDDDDTPENTFDDISDCNHAASPPTPVGGPAMDNPPTPVGGSALDNPPTPSPPPPPPLSVVPLPPSPPTGVGGLCPAHWRADGLDPRPRYLIGKAKSWCSRHVKAAGLLQCPAGLFAKRGKIVPIESRRHQLAVVRYIRRHVNEGGAVQSLTQSL